MPSRRPRRLLLSRVSATAAVDGEYVCFAWWFQCRVILSRPASSARRDVVSFPTVAVEPGKDTCSRLREFAGAHYAHARKGIGGARLVVVKCTFGVTAMLGDSVDRIGASVGRGMARSGSHARLRQCAGPDFAGGDRRAASSPAGGVRGRRRGGGRGRPRGRRMRRRGHGAGAACACGAPDVGRCWWRRRSTRVGSPPRQRRASPRSSVAPRRLADRLVTVVTAAKRGEGTLPPDLLGRLLEQVGQLQRQVLHPRGIAFNGLSHREIEIFRLVADGDETDEIARKLCYSQRTIKNSLHDVTSRLQLRNCSHAVAYALRQGLI